VHVRVRETVPDLLEDRVEVSGRHALRRDADHVGGRHGPGDGPPLVSFGQAGLPPPPQRKNDTLPFTFGWATWTWAKSTGELFSPEYVSVYEIDFWSSLTFSVRWPVPLRVNRRHLVVPDQVGLELIPVV
jgi:hypothetical protein